MEFFPFTSPAVFKRVLDAFHRLEEPKVFGTFNMRGITRKTSTKSRRRTRGSRPVCHRKPPSKKAGTVRISNTPVSPNHLPLFSVGTTYQNMVMKGMKLTSLMPPIKPSAPSAPVSMRNRGLGAATKRTGCPDT